MSKGNNKVVIFNAPKNSGKDYLVDKLSDILEKRQFKTELYHNTADYYGIELETVIRLASDRDWKETPHDLFYGKTPRQGLIHVSENIYKPRFGKDYYAQALVKSLNGGHYGVSDGGFQEEFDTLVSELGSDNVLLIRMFTQDSSFEGDSRQYIEDNKGCVVYDVFNSKKDDDDVQYMRRIVEEWLYE